MNWKYTNIHHAFRRKAGISLNEYAVLDIIYQSQSHPSSRTDDGWSTVSYGEVSDFLELSKGAIHKIVERSCTAGLMEVDPDNPARKRTTAIWYENAYLDEENEIEEGAKVVKLEREKAVVQKVNGVPSVQKVNDIVQKVNGKRSKSERSTLVLKRSIKETKEIPPMGGPLTDEDNVRDFEEQLDGQQQNPSSDNLAEGPEQKKKKVAPKKKSEPERKWNGSFKIAIEIFDNHRKVWMKKRKGIEGEPLYWSGKECRQFSNFLTALKKKAEDAGHIYPTDEDFIKTALPAFLEAAASLEKYYMDEFTPTRFYSNFNTLYTDIKTFFKHGNNADKKPRSGHQISTQRLERINSLLS